MENISSHRFIANTRDDSQNREDIIREFIRSDLPLILVTPSAHEGMDFRDDICRWQVICKIPYPDLNDKQVKRRMEIDRRWYLWKTILRLVQTYGRGTRSDSDWCDTFLFDSSFGSLWKQCKNIMPVWFREAIVEIKALDEVITTNADAKPMKKSAGDYTRCIYCNRPFLSESENEEHEVTCPKKPHEE
jgi:Rad3-related DNA helicase